jgi:hypothetical protein
METTSIVGTFTILFRNGPMRRRNRVHLVRI